MVCLRHTEYKMASLDQMGYLLAMTPSPPALRLGCILSEEL